MLTLFIGEHKRDFFRDVQPRDILLDKSDCRSNVRKVGSDVGHSVSITYFPARHARRTQKIDDGQRVFRQNAN